MHLERGTDETVEETMAEKLPNLMGTINPRIQELNESQTHEI